MNAEIIAVGTELLLGEIINSDAKFLAERLSALGINVFYQTVVGDNHARLLDAIKTALLRSDLVITSGGLGPTHDDITKETLAEAMGFELELHQPSLDDMQSFFNKINRQMSPTNIKQAMMPVGGIVLKNNNGTAPGGIIEKGGKTAIFLPGPPREIVPMFEESVYPYLREKSDDMFYSKTLRIHGMGESTVEQHLSEFMRAQSNPTVAPYAKDDETTLRITAKCKNEADGENMIAPVEKQVRDILGDVIYGVNGDTLYKVVFDMLRRKKLTISFAESCTGGMLVQKLTDMAGASEVFCESVVTYANSAKEKYLGVSGDTLVRYGAVSEQTAKEMAQGLHTQSGADICVAVTGIAGPDGGSEEKPVGLVYIAVWHSGAVEVRECRFAGNRDRVRSRACIAAYGIVREILKRA